MGDYHLRLAGPLGLATALLSAASANGQVSPPRAAPGATLAGSGPTQAGTPLGGPGRRTLGGSGSVRIEELPAPVTALVPPSSPQGESSFRTLVEQFDRMRRPQ